MSTDEDREPGKDGDKVVPLQKGQSRLDLAAPLSKKRAENAARKAGKDAKARNGGPAAGKPGGPAAEKTAAARQGAGPAQPKRPGTGPAPRGPRAAEADFVVGPTASPARPRRRHLFVALSFLQVVLLPLAVCAWYLYGVAADQYASYLGFSVRTEEKNTAIDLLGGITNLSSSSSSDTDILFAYLTSQELVRKADEAVDLRAIWSRVPKSKDPIFAFDPSGTIEDLVDHWKRKVQIVYDSSTGMIDLRILSFSAKDSRRIADFLLNECSEMINQLSAIAREDAIKYAREELEGAVERLKKARRDVTEFRNRHQIVDPTIDIQGQMGLLTTLQQQLAETLIDVDLLKDTARENDPRILQAQRRVAVIENRIEAERRKLGIGSSGGGSDVYANLVGEYEGLVVERQFAEEAYTSALAAYASARTAARRQSRYLAAHVPPTLAETAEFPERAKDLALIGLMLMITWSIGILLFYSLRDRR